MNPRILGNKTNNTIYFDSNFESGNLDVVIKTDIFSYDLFMRIDANTKGHNQWLLTFSIK